MAFWLSGKVVALHLDNGTDKEYLCNQGGTASLFLSKLAYCILNLANKHGITLIQHTNLPISMWKLTIYHGEGWFWNGTFSFAKLRKHFNFWVHQRLHPLIPISVSIITSWKSPYLWESWG